MNFDLEELDKQKAQKSRSFKPALKPVPRARPHSAAASIARAGDPPAVANTQVPAETQATSPDHRQTSLPSALPFQRPPAAVPGARNVVPGCAPSGLRTAMAAAANGAAAKGAITGAEAITPLQSMVANQRPPAAALPMSNTVVGLQPSGQRPPSEPPQLTMTEARSASVAPAQPFPDLEARPRPSPPHNCQQTQRTDPEDVPIAKSDATLLTRTVLPNSPSTTAADVTSPAATAVSLLDPAPAAVAFLAPTRSAPAVAIRPQPPEPVSSATFQQKDLLSLSSQPKIVKFVPSAAAGTRRPRQPGSSGPLPEPATATSAEATDITAESTALVAPRQSQPSSWMEGQISHLQGDWVGSSQPIPPAMQRDGRQVDAAALGNPEALLTAPVMEHSQQHQQRELRPPDARRQCDATPVEVHSQPCVPASQRAAAPETTFWAPELPPTECDAAAAGGTSAQHPSLSIDKFSCTGTTNLAAAPVPSSVPGLLLSAWEATVDHVTCGLNTHLDADSSRDNRPANRPPAALPEAAQAADTGTVACTAGSPPKGIGGGQAAVLSGAAEVQSSEAFEKLLGLPAAPHLGQVRAQRSAPVVALQFRGASAQTLHSPLLPLLSPPLPQHQLQEPRQALHQPSTHPLQAPSLETHLPPAPAVCTPTDAGKDELEIDLAAQRDKSWLQGPQDRYEASLSQQAAIAAVEQNHPKSPVCGAQSGQAAPPPPVVNAVGLSISVAATAAAAATALEAVATGKAAAAGTVATAEVPAISGQSTGFLPGGFEAADLDSLPKLQRRAAPNVVPRKRGQMAAVVAQSGAPFTAAPLPPAQPHIPNHTNAPTQPVAAPPPVSAVRAAGAQAGSTAVATTVLQQSHAAALDSKPGMTAAAVGLLKATATAEAVNTTQTTATAAAAGKLNLPVEVDAVIFPLSSKRPLGGASGAMEVETVGTVTQLAAARRPQRGCTTAAAKVETKVEGTTVGDGGARVADGRREATTTVKRARMSQQQRNGAAVQNETAHDGGDTDEPVDAVDATVEDAGPPAKRTKTAARSATRKPRRTKASIQSGGVEEDTDRKAAAPPHKQQPIRSLDPMLAAARAQSTSQHVLGLYQSAESQSSKKGAMSWMRLLSSIRTNLARRPTAQPPECGAPLPEDLSRALVLHPDHINLVAAGRRPRARPRPPTRSQSAELAVHTSTPSGTRKTRHGAKDAAPTASHSLTLPLPRSQGGKKATKRQAVAAVAKKAQRRRRMEQNALQEAGLALVPLPAINLSEPMDTETWTLRKIIARTQAWEKAKMAKERAETRAAAATAAAAAVADAQQQQKQGYGASGCETPALLATTSVGAVVRKPTVAIGPAAPRVRAVDGQLVVDTATLTVTAQQADDVAQYTRVEEDTRFVTSFTYMRRLGPARWSETDTALFYRALGAFGTDFSLICMLFPDMQREHVKRKYMKELKERPAMVNSALSRRGMGPGNQAQLLETVRARIAVVNAQQSAQQTATAALPAPAPASAEFGAAAVAVREGPDAAIEGEEASARDAVVRHPTAMTPEGLIPEADGEEGVVRQGAQGDGEGDGEGASQGDGRGDTAMYGAYGAYVDDGYQQGMYTGYEDEYDAYY